MIIVDDDAVGRRVLIKQLERQGFRDISFAVNGAEALEAISSQREQASPFDVVLSDVEMPVRSRCRPLSLGAMLTACTGYERSHIDKSAGALGVLIPA